MSLKIDKTRRIIGLSRKCTLWILERKGRNHWLFHLMNIWKYMTVDLNLETNLKCLVFGKDKLEYRDISIPITLAIFGQSGFKFWCRGKVLWHSETKSPPEVRSYQLTFWRINENSRAKRHEFEEWRVSRLTASSTNSGPSTIHCMDKIHWKLIAYSKKSREL